MSEKVLKKLELLASSKLLTTLHGLLGPEADLHLVGGTVRDLLSEQESYDLDLASKFPPSQTIEILKQADIRVIETGIQHGTLTAVMDKTNIEITTFRKPGSRKASTFSDSIEEDLSGRDFTINAMAYSLEHRRLLDPHNGVQDLNYDMLRAVGSADERIKDDPLRILRAIRFGPASGRTLVSPLPECIKKRAALLETVSVERIKAEFEKILTSSYPVASLREMLDLGILNQIMPEILPSVDFEQNEYHNEDVFGHTLSVIKAAQASSTQRLAALFHDLGKPLTLSVGEDGRRHFYKHEIESKKICEKVMKRLRFSNQEIRRVAAIVSYHMRPLDCGPAGVRRLIRDLGEYFDDWLLFKEADASPGVDPAISHRHLEDFKKMLKEEEERQKGSPYGKLALNGDDIISLGVPEGPEVGKILKELEAEVIRDPEKNDREFLLKTVKRFLS